MDHDNASMQPLTIGPEVSSLIEQAMQANVQKQDEHTPVPSRGRPARLSQNHLAWAVIWYLMMGLHAQLEIWRTLRLGFQCFAPLVLSNQVDLLPAPMVDCKVHAKALRLGLRPGTLLLFDLGYFNFEWFDDLTRAGHCWISHMRQRTIYDLAHILQQQDGYLEALVWLGTSRADQAAFLVRLIQVRHHGQWYRSLTNVRDSLRLSGAELGRVYARRWDIELAFRALKDHLGLTLLWSAKWEVIGGQILANLLLANIFHAAQRQIAQQAGVELFEVSMDLLVRYVSRLLQQGRDPIATLVRCGRQLGVIRPRTRRRLQVPDSAWHLILWPPSDLLVERVPHYAHHPGGHARRKKSQAK